MSDVISELKENEKKLRFLQQEKAKKEGKIMQILEILKKDFGVRSVDEAILVLQKIREEVDTHEKTLGEINGTMEKIIVEATKR